MMFGSFVVATLWITKWAASRTRSAADFYTAGGKIGGFQNGLAICGDWCSSAALMGIAANLIAKYIERYRWIAYVGLAVIVYVAGKMIYEGVVDPNVGLMKLFG